MVFKGRFFSSSSSSSHKQSTPKHQASPSSEPSANGSSSPKTPTLDLTVRSDKKKGRQVKEDPQIGLGPCRQTLAKDSKSKKKEIKPKESPLKQDLKEKGRSASNSVVTKLKKIHVDSVKDENLKARLPDLGSCPPSQNLVVTLGLNRIKTRSGPLPQEASLKAFADGMSMKSSGPGASKLSRTEASSSAQNLSRNNSNSISPGNSSGAKVSPLNKELQRRGVSHDNISCGSWVDADSNCDSMSTGGQSRDQSPSVDVGFKNPSSSNGSAEAGQRNFLWSQSEGFNSSNVCTPDAQTPCGISEAPNESESPRFQAIMRLTSAPRRNPGDIKSFSHELNSKGVKPFPFWKPRGLFNLTEVVAVIRAKFDRAKEEVDSDLAVFAGDLVGLLEKNAEVHPEWQETLEDLLILARQCTMMSPGEFWLQCEGIVQDIDDRRQELPMGVLKKLYTRMLFILTRCTRLLQFHKENSFVEDEPSFAHRQSGALGYSAEKMMPSTVHRDEGFFSDGKKLKAKSTMKFYSQEQDSLWRRSQAVASSATISSQPDAEATKNVSSPSSMGRFTSYKKFNSASAEKNQKESFHVKEEPSSGKVDTMRLSDRGKTGSDTDLLALKSSELAGQSSVPAKHHHKVSWGYWGDQQNVSDEPSMICRICEEEVPTFHLEDHSRICTLADRCDLKGLSVNERLVRIAETLEKIMESYTPKDAQNLSGSPDVAKISNSSVTEDSDIMSPKLSDWSRRGSEDMLDCFPEADNSVVMDELKGLPSMSCKTRFGPKSDQGMATSSAGSMTPRSPLLTPRIGQIDLLLAGRSTFTEYEDLPQITELADIARCVANATTNEDQAVDYLVSCLEDLQEVVQRRKLDALTVQTVGARIEKLIKEKYMQLCDVVYDEKGDISSSVIDEDGPMEDDTVRSLRASPIHSSSKDRTSIDDFEIIKPISRGAFGRVFLAKKKTTGDLFAIKVLKKADMIRKNAVESILAERDILISVRNPFVVRFFYSFTCRENLYLVMEYLNGGDLYSLLRNLGCLDEDVARVYIAEVVLALEYLHSLRVVHRDLKPDNLLIAHDGHIKLTDFGLSKVGLINSTDDLSGPAVGGTSLLGEDEPQVSVLEQSDQRERRQKRSAVGTPDYLAPEILLGTGHGTTADWWSVGVILFELLVGIPPFNAEHPQTIFDNILNRKIPWPRIPEEMSNEAQDLIDKLLTEDPHQRLGANGAAEVKQHPFFKDINWDTLARQKAAFVPTSDSALDTSYFTSRYNWNSSDERVCAADEFEDTSDCGSISGSSSSLSNRQDEQGDECGGLAEFDSSSSVKYSFSNFSFKNLSQLASINFDLLTKSWKDDASNDPNP
ncbi:probable serine/threonine protein kinase IREH1 isoform X1 [Amborella trichopoda]|nr:probable serine/threonine protein kinase IREH1 isoform X1 [Amborella trichopoda]|eukprot:XP_020519544.1 probable serine/threonine protein kinase IREH1 isoform X1 [Amborella trichopoda]